MGTNLTSIAGKTVLVTGSDGFIGSHLTEKLLQSNCDVRCLVYYNSLNSWGWLDTLPAETRSRLKIIQGDIRDPYGMRKAIEGSEIVFHLAALIGIPFSYHSPDLYIDTNIKGTLNVLQASKELGVQKILHTSTSEVYGTAQFVPITEEHPLLGQSPYSASKIGADQLAYSFYSSFNTPVSIVRPFNTYGPRQSLRAVIPTIIAQLAAGKRSIKLGSISPTRDFNYVADTVAGFIAIAESSGTEGETFNVGSNFEISIEDTFNLIASEMKINATIETEENRLRPSKSEVERLWADNKKILSKTNWKPQFVGRDGFKKGISQTIHWFSNPLNLNFYRDKVSQYTI